MDLGNDFIPVTSRPIISTATQSITTHTSDTATQPITTPTEAQSSTQSSTEAKIQIERVLGINELSKDILIISLACLCLILAIILAIIFTKWRKLKRAIQFNVLAAGSSQSVFNGTKFD